MQWWPGVRPAQDGSDQHRPRGISGDQVHHNCLNEGPVQIQCACGRRSKKASEWSIGVLPQCASIKGGSAPALQTQRCHIPYGVKGRRT